MFQMFNKCYGPQCVSQLYIYIVEHGEMCLWGTIVNKLSSLTGLSWGERKPTLFAHAIYKPCKKQSLIESTCTFTDMKHCDICLKIQSLDFSLLNILGKLSILKIKIQSMNKLPQNVYNCNSFLSLERSNEIDYIVLRVNIRLLGKANTCIFTFISSISNIPHSAN